MRSNSGCDGSENTINYKTPIYLQLREIIRNKIEDGEYTPGTAIPSENELSETYGINRITVRNAINALVNEGLLRSVQGKGVFVVGNKAEETIAELNSFIPVLPKHFTIKEQVKEIRPAGDLFSTIFNIGMNDSIYSIVQIVLSSSQPISYDEIFIPVDIVPQLQVASSSVFSIDDIFDFYGVVVSSVRQNLEIIKGTQRTRHILGDVPPEIAIMKLESSYLNNCGQVIEYKCSYVRSDTCSFKVFLDAT
jgi:GntR family transcriptional regulator